MLGVYNQRIDTTLISLRVEICIALSYMLVVER